MTVEDAQNINPDSLFAENEAVHKNSSADDLQTALQALLMQKKEEEEYRFFKLISVSALWLSFFLALADFLKR